MGAELTWLPPSDDDAQSAPVARPESIVLPLDLPTLARTCDRHPAALATFYASALDLAFCGHCANYGAAQALPLDRM